MIHSVLLNRATQDVYVRIERADDLVAVLVDGEYLDAARHVNSDPIGKDIKIPVGNSAVTRVTIVGVNYGGNFHPYGFLVVDGIPVQPSFGNRDHFEHNVPDGVRSVTEYWLVRSNFASLPDDGTIIRCASWQSNPIKSVLEGNLATYSCLLELCAPAGPHAYDGNFFIEANSFGRLVEFDCQTIIGDARDDLEFITFKIGPALTLPPNIIRHQVNVRYRNRGLKPAESGSVIAQPKLFFSPS